jgi:hypothetical protein
VWLNTERLSRRGADGGMTCMQWTLVLRASCCQEVRQFTAGHVLCAGTHASSCC